MFPLIAGRSLYFKMDRRIHRVIILITDNLHREIDLTEISQQMNISASRLRHLFKEQTGLSPLQYIKAERMKRASQLLETTYLNIKEIMSRVGIRDKSHFARDFKSAYGCSPVQYRNKHYVKAAPTERMNSHISHVMTRTANK